MCNDHVVLMGRTCFEVEYLSIWTGWISCRCVGICSRCSVLDKCKSWGMIIHGGKLEDDKEYIYRETHEPLGRRVRSQALVLLHCVSTWWVIKHISFREPRSITTCNCRSEMAILRFHVATTHKSSIRSPSYA